MVKLVKLASRTAVVRVVSRHRVTLPKDVLAVAGIAPGDELRIEAEDSGRLILVRSGDAG